MPAAAPRPRSDPPAGPARGSGGRALAASFRYAWAGLVETALHQRNMRIHLLLATALSAVASGVPLSTAAELALLLCVFLVLAAEVANSALEALVDLVTRQRDERARAAKDAGAGAVLLLAIGSVLVAVAVVLGEGPALLAAPGRLLRQVALAVPLLAIEGALLAPRPRRPSIDAALAVSGTVLLGALWPDAVRWTFALLGVALHVLDVAVAAARRRALARE